jgi:hypothetical protein
VPFQAHLELLRCFLARRDEIVERIQSLLNAQRRPTPELQDRATLSRRVEDCFFALEGLTPEHSRLRGTLQAAHWASGFRPRAIPGLHNAPAEPAELMARAIHVWQQTRWPGRNGRLHFAHTLFNLFVVASLELLSMRVWDDASSGAGERLAQIQSTLDRLWSIRTVAQPVLVRDARWLVPLAQSSATDDLRAYFEVARRIADTLSREDRIAIHDAGARMAGGHLRSQLRHHSMTKGVPFDDASVVEEARRSNALDFALLVEDLVPLLEAYEDAGQHGDVRARSRLADALCQGISADPELFLDRIDLLREFSTIEHLFVTTDADGHRSLTPIGRRHQDLLREYETRIARMAAPLAEDCAQFTPVPGAYSPYGVLFGFSSDLVKHMVLKASQPESECRFGLEDVFVAGGADVLAWVSGWRKLPHLTRDVERLFEYPQSFAEAVFERTATALRTRAAV